jgi:hypothetical protein
VGCHLYLSAGLDLDLSQIDPELYRAPFGFPEAFKWYYVKPGFMPNGRLFCELHRDHVVSTVMVLFMSTTSAFILARFIFPSKYYLGISCSVFSSRIPFC